MMNIKSCFFIYLLDTTYKCWWFSVNFFCFWIGC